MTDSTLKAMPSRAERQQVNATLDNVRAENFDEVVILGFKNGATYLHHSKIASVPLLVGAIE